MSEQLKYESTFTVVSALPPGYAKRPPGEPAREVITLTIDGAEVRAPEGVMLVDAAKYGGVEIPVFCYEPKLGNPVGACRMCLVEIEGIPKLQTACSTPVRDGMVVSTKSPRVIEAQEGVVEFLLTNHPLDCPVCDKGGECPLQDISYGWGRGESRFVEPKRHFEKPVALSPAIAIDRERCILCYRCVRFSQEVSEDYQLVLLERGAATYVGTFDGGEYVAPFSGNVIELCPVGALTSRAYRFRARPWDIEQGGSICTLCPAQCNVSYSVRDERVARVLARENSGVDDGWLCDRGRFAYQAWEGPARITTPLVRQGDKLLPARWDHALQVAADALAKSGAKTAALAGGSTTNEEAWLLRRLMLEALGAPNFDAHGGARLAPDVVRTLTGPRLQLATADLEWADQVLVLGTELIDEMPVVDLRVRKGVNRNGARLAVATARPSVLDAKAAHVARYAPGRDGVFAQALCAAVTGAGDVADLAARAGANAADVQAIADALRGAERAAIVLGERATTGAGGQLAAQAVCSIAGALGLAAEQGSGVYFVPLAANARGMREAGLLPDFDPGLADRAEPGMPAGEIAARAGEAVAAVILLDTDPVAEFADGAAWDSALAKTASVISFASWLDPATARHATVVFPAEAPPEKEGTVTHPDGRLQRLRQTVDHAGEVRAGWWVLAQLAERLGADLGVRTVHQASSQVVAAVPFYAGLTPGELSGGGKRWTERPAAARMPEPARRGWQLETPPALPPADGRLRLGVFRPLWNASDVRNAPAIAPLAARSRVELAPADGERLGVRTGDDVTLVTAAGEAPAVAALRDNVPAGTAFVLDARDDALRAALAGGPEFVEVRK